MFYNIFSHKPMIIGLKANVVEIAITYQTAYPNARIQFADEKSFKADNRMAFFNQIKNNDYDCVIMEFVLENIFTSDQVFL